jgi:uncharacterized protein YcgI (DUF1989 family)
MNVLRGYFTMFALVALVRVLAGCSDSSSGPTGGRSGDPAVCQDDEDEPGDTDTGDDEDGDRGADECEDDD